jgi:hypothetical protein
MAKSQAQAAGILHRADRQQSGSRPDGLEQGGLGIDAAQDDLAHLHSQRRQGQPDHAVGGEFLVADDHLVARAPVEAEGDEGQGLGGVLDQCDIAGARCIQQTH